MDGVSVITFINVFMGSHPQHGDDGSGTFALVKSSGSTVTLAKKVVFKKKGTSVALG